MEEGVPKIADPIPGNVSYNGYMATRNYCGRSSAPDHEQHAVIKQLEGHKMSAADRMQHYDAYIDPVTHQVQQTIYLARRNAKPKDETDLYEIITWSKPEAVIDDAAAGKCKLKPFADVPTYET